MSGLWFRVSCHNKKNNLVLNRSWNEVNTTLDEWQKMTTPLHYSSKINQKCRSVVWKIVSCSIIFWFHRGKCLVSILESSVRMFVWQLKLVLNWIIQQEYDPTEKRIKVLQWPNHTSHLNIMNMWWELRAVHKQIPANFNELRQQCREKSQNSPNNKVRD